MQAWLREHVGAGDYAMYGGSDNVLSCYFRSAAAAQRFFEAFPDHEFADTTAKHEHLREARRWAASRSK